MKEATYIGEHNVTDENSASHRRLKFNLSNVGAMLGIMMVILPALGTFGYPWFTGFLSRAVAAEVNTQVQTQVAPINAAMKVILESQVVALEDEIGSMEFRRDRSPTTWTENDARELLVKQRRLAAQRQALTAMDAVQRRRDGS